MEEGKHKTLEQEGILQDEHRDLYLGLAVFWKASHWFSVQPMLTEHLLLSPWQEPIDNWGTQCMCTTSVYVYYTYI